MPQEPHLHRLHLSSRNEGEPLRALTSSSSSSPKELLLLLRQGSSLAKQRQVIHVLFLTLMLLDHNTHRC